MIAAVDMRKILVIDDELGPRESLRILLKPDYKVFCADSVARGLELLREQTPDLIIMDIRMPGMSGIEGLREIRKLDPVVSVIMLTGFGALETAQEAIRLGASDYLKKPFDTREILDVISHNLRKTEVNRRRAAMERELRDLNSRLVGELAKKDRMASLGQASAELVHDLRNPLAVVLGYVQILSEDLQKARASESSTGQLDSSAEYIGIIEQSIQRCRDLIESWQDLGRKSPRERTSVSVDGIVRTILKGQERLAAERRVAIELQNDSDSATVLGDATQLTRAIQNVIGNAVEAVPEDTGRVRVALRIQDEAVHVVVQDNGPGLSAENMAHMFEPYFTTKAGKRGTGLGLFITKKVIDDHNGGIRIESRPGLGATVTIWLPAWSEAESAS